MPKIRKNYRISQETDTQLDQIVEYLKQSTNILSDKVDQTTALTFAINYAHSQLIQETQTKDYH